MLGGICVDIYRSCCVGDVVEEKTISVQNELGLHARPAAKIAQAAQKYSASIHIKIAEREIDAKSILDILSLAAPMGTDVAVKASGHDATEAVSDIVRLFKERFGEER
ncbi:HPr family phosphocarrier protein [Desulfoplanes sp.]